MVDTPVNEDISSFKNIVIAGMDARETISGIVCILSCGTILGISRIFQIPSVVSIIIMLPLMAVLIFVINYKKDDFNFIEAIKGGRYKKRKKFLSYDSTENYEFYNVPIVETEEVDEDAEFDKLLKKIIVAGIMTVLLIIAGIVAIVLLK